MQILAVGAVRHDHRILAVVVGPVDVGAQHQAVVHFDGHVPIDAHAVAHFATKQAVARVFDVVHGLPLEVRMLEHTSVFAWPYFSAKGSARASR